MATNRLRFSVSLLCSCVLIAAHAETPMGGNNLGDIQAIAVDAAARNVYSADKRGYLVRWSVAGQAAAERFQCSPYGLTGVALRADSDELAVAESDGYGIYRVSAWNFKEKRKLFTLRFRDPISFIAYSERGSYLIVARNSLDGLVLLDPATGEQLSRFKEATGLAAFAATGKSERTMLSYSSTGELIYWNLADGSLIQRNTAPENLASVALFGSGRFLAGTVDEALVVIDALSGAELARQKLRGTIAIAEGASTDSVTYIRRDEDGAFAGIVSADGGGVSFSAETFLFVGADGGRNAIAAAAGKRVYLAAGSGKVAAVDVGGAAAAAADLSYKTFRPIMDASYALGRGLALTLGDEQLVVPAKPAAFRSGKPVVVASERADRLLALNDGPLIVWTADGAVLPRTAAENAEEGMSTGIVAAPLHADSYGRFALFLDAGGALTLYDALQGKHAYGFSSIGMLDAAVIDERRLLIAKSASVPPYAALIATNFLTGETVPLAVPGKAAVRVHRGSSGRLYAIIADSDAEGPITRLIRVDPDNSAMTTMFEYRAEDVQASLVEVGPSVATTLGGDGISLFTPRGFVRAERSASLPKRLEAAEDYLIAVCDDGALVWYDPEKGTAEARLTFSGRMWSLDERGRISSGSF